MTPIKALIGVTFAANDLLAAIIGTTDQFNPEINRLERACSKAEKVIQAEMRKAAGVQ